MLTWLAEVTPTPSAPVMWWQDPFQVPSWENRGWLALIVVGIAVAVLVANGVKRDQNNS